MGGGASWTVARCLLFGGIEEALCGGCIREVAAAAGRTLCGIWFKCLDAHDLEGIMVTWKRGHALAMDKFGGGVYVE